MIKICADRGHGILYHEENRETVTFNNGTIKTKGGDYGIYRFNIILPAGTIENETENFIIHLDYFNTNNWYIVNSKCNILLREKDGRYKGTIHIESKYNDGTNDQFSKDVKTRANKKELSVFWSL